jgi:outer membrane lipoprotein SlyB
LAQSVKFDLRVREEMSFRIVTLVCVLTSLFTSSGRAQQNTDRGAIVGGVTGAVIGGLVGKQNQKTTGGALIGGAVGAVAGGLMGKAQDNDLARQRNHAYQQGYYASQQQTYVQNQMIEPVGVSVADVVTMSRSGVNESVIVAQLHSRGVQRRLEVSDIISLHQQGVHDSLISAMQSAPLASQMGRSSQTPVQTYVQPAPVIVRQQPVIIREHAPVIVDHHQYHGHHFHGPRHSVSYGFSF